MSQSQTTDLEIKKLQRARNLYIIFSGLAFGILVSALIDVFNWQFRDRDENVVMAIIGIAIGLTSIPLFLRFLKLYKKLREQSGD